MQLSISQVREWAEAGTLYAILDACDLVTVVEKVRELGEKRAVSLYRGMAEEVYEYIAPYLVQVDPSVYDWIVETLWPEPWGIFVKSHSEFAALRTHFRKFLIVDSPDGDKWYFRYYDPRVLGAYLPTCTDDEVAQFFGPVEMFGITAPGDLDIVILTPQSSFRTEVQ